MPAQRTTKGLLAMRNVEESELPIAPEVQPQGEITNAKFCEDIRMLCQVVTNQVGQQQGARLEEVDTSRIREFFRMNPPSFTNLSTTEDPVNFVEQLKKLLM